MISLIVACSTNRVIGRDTKLPWSIPEDHRWFHQLTANKTLILGRICYETWPKAHADKRRPIVITSRSPEALRPQALPNNYTPALLARDLPSALLLAQEQAGEIIICGGQRIFEESLPFCDRLYLTEVHAEISGDVYFPEWKHLPWKVLETRDSSDAGYALTFSVLERIPTPPKSD